MKALITLSILSCLSLNLINKDTETVVPKIEIFTTFNNQDIVYRGLINPIVIKVENNTKYKATGIGLKKVDDLGNYKLIPSSGKEVIIKVIGQHINGNLFEVSKTFKIKNIGKGVSQFNGKSCKECNLKLSKKELSSGRVSFDFPDIQIDGLSTKVKSFKIKIPGKSTKTVYGNRIISKLLLKDIQKIKTGSIIQIFDITIKSFFPENNGVRVCKISPIIIKITS